MKRLLKSFIINLISILLLSLLLPSFKLQLTLNSILITSACLTLLDLIVKPLIKLLLLPLNLVTFGLMGWLASAIILYLLVLVVNGVIITPLSVPAFSLGFISFPPFYFGRTLSLIIASFVLNLIRMVLKWVTK